MKMNMEVCQKIKKYDPALQPLIYLNLIFLN